MVKPLTIPAPFHQDINRAVQILKEAGCTQIFLFGSAAAGKTHRSSDIDLAVRGCPPGKFFLTLGRLMLEIDRSIDLVNLDSQDPFAQYLQEKGEIYQVG